jgi:HEAT repeat protein
MATALSPAKLKAARSSFYVFNALNSFSFVLLSGSFITLFALRLGASNGFVGILNSFAYATFFFLPVGKALVRRQRIIDVFGWGWFFRYVGMIPVLAAPLVAAWGHPGLAFGLIAAGVALFNVFRGIALIGNNPVLASLAEGKDRGSFLVNVQIVNNLAGMGTSLLVALALGAAAVTGLYLAFIGAGIAVGIIGSVVLLRTPEPEAYRPADGGGLLEAARGAIKEKPFRSFFEVLLIVSFAAGMARSFLPVYAKAVYAQGDDLVMAYSLLASLGAVAMGLLTRLLVDRLGAKPLYVIFTAVTALSLVPAIVSPGMASPLAVVAFLAAFNFVSSFGLAGEDNAGQTYYFGLVPRERNLDLSVVYFLAYGLGGALGSGAGGFVLEVLAKAGLGARASWRIFFAAVLFFLAWALIRMVRLMPLGSASVRESLGVIFSPRDLRVFDLLARLDRSASPAEEVRLIHEIGNSASPRGQHELLAYLASPRFEVRVEALLAIENLESLEKDVLQALVREVERNPWTTAYIAARILGKQGDLAYLPVLKAALRADDYMLQGSAMVAVARLGDEGARPEIEDILLHTDKPRVKLQAAYALEVLGNRDSVPALVSCLRRDDPPAYVSDELVLAVAGILGLLDSFYPIYAAFLEDEAQGVALLHDAVEARGGEVTAFGRAVTGMLGEPNDGAAMGQLVMGVGSDPGVEIVLAEAALDASLGYRGFRFFIAAYWALAKRDRP